MTKEEKTDFSSYAEAYGVLRGIAEDFKRGGPGDIDTLVAKFRLARGAFGFCRQRLDAVSVEIEAEIAHTTAQ